MSRSKEQWHLTRKELPPGRGFCAIGIVEMRDRPWPVCFQSKTAGWLDEINWAYIPLSQVTHWRDWPASQSTYHEEDSRISSLLSFVPMPKNRDGVAKCRTCGLLHRRDKICEAKAILWKLRKEKRGR
jgi:hypothetical protein